MFLRIVISFVLNLSQYTVVDRWQLDSKTERSLRCLLAKANLMNET